eukprot:CAMPEP_0179102992 /NCGR_PEP_ID=MMETSP0796-20121207/47696_1 /TAXON_ID=73915 /ORGANISM="Pyrodinium bahamense, Strain pbaha01" /LENGTH=558 /DNA_ID=CAMNT_0020800881 /DNA_START=132 /DNA_END=1808 /DNA_ORIENTATION=+
MTSPEDNRIFEDAKLQLENDLDSDHMWHFRYNRRLQCFSQSVTSLTFSGDGHFLVSGTASGDVKVWDTGSWSEAARLKGCLRKEPRALMMSPGQRWLVSAYPSVLQIFQCAPPWRLEQSLPSILDPATKEPQDWMCIAFSPNAEVDHPRGKTGQDNHFAAFSTGALVVLDYSNGWGTDAPRRTRSLMQSSRPTSLAYTSCGWWILCGFEGGQLQIWNAFSLTLEKTLNGHANRVTCVAASPREAAYDARFVSGGLDQTLRVWHSNGWILEQHVHDTRCDWNGILDCTFSASGTWLVSVACELSVWRVQIRGNGRLVLSLHQRLAAICGAEGLRAAAFCSNNDAIAVGSRDGVLGLWTKYPGSPPDIGDCRDSPSAESPGGVRSAPWTGSMTGSMELPRPMQRLTPQGLKPLGRPGQARGEWFQRAHLRTMSMASLGPRGGGSSGLSASGRLTLSTGDRSASSSGCNSPVSGTVGRSLSRPDVMPRWKSQGIGDMLSQIDAGDSGRCSSPKGLSSTLPARVDTMPDYVSPVRKSMLHACSRGPVKRISLEPKVIIDNTK